MVGAFIRLTVERAREAELGEQLAHAVGADRMAHVGKRAGQLVHALRHRQQRPLRIAQGRRLNETLEVGKQHWITRSQRPRAATLMAHPAAWRRGRVEVFQPRFLVCIPSQAQDVESAFADAAVIAGRKG